MEKGNILDLYKTGNLKENIFLSITWMIACALPFTLLYGKFQISVIIWVVAAISIFIFKFLRSKRTKEKIDVSVIPKIKF
jgi:uncharacterized membrane protein